MTGIPQTGKLSQVPLPRLLAKLNREKVTGALSVSSGNFLKKIYYKDGSAIFASSNFEDDRLGEMLVKAGKITVEQYDRSVEILKKTGKRQGGILVELGYITPKDLFWGVKYQVREIIYSIFLFEKGDYEFTATENIPDEVITLRMSTGNLIYEGVKRIENWTRIRRELPPTDAVLKLSDDPLNLFQEVEFTPHDKKILSLIDGKRKIKQVIESSWLNSFEAMKIIYLIWSLGIVTEKKVDGVSISVDELLKPVSEGEETLKKRVTEFHRKMPLMDKYEILEVKKGASAEEIKRNYYRLAKEFHPDRFFDSDDKDLRSKLSAIFDAVTAAYNSLKGNEPARAEEFDLKEPAQKKADPKSAAPKKITARPVQMQKAVSKPAQAGKSVHSAEEEVRTGLDFLKKGDLDSALKSLRKATALEPLKASNWSCLALALSRSPNGLKEAEEALYRAIKLEPANAEYYANLGLLYLKGKMPEKARRLFEKSLALNSDNMKARQGLKQLGN